MKRIRPILLPVVLLLTCCTVGGAPKSGNVYRVLADAEGDTVWVMPAITPALRLEVLTGDAKELTKGTVLVSCPVKDVVHKLTQGSTPVEVHQAVLECKSGLRLAATGIALE